MSRKQVTKKVTQTYIEITCDYCHKEIYPSQIPKTDYLPAGKEVHVECWDSIVKEALRVAVDKGL